MKLWLAHPTGNTFVRALLVECARSACDFDFFTTVGFTPGRLKPSRRSYPVAGRHLHCRPALEIARLLGLGVSIDRVYRDLDSAVAGRLRRADAKPRAVYAYEDGAREIFATAGDLGIQRVYDLPIAYWQTTRRLLEQEAERLPEWEPTLVSPADSLEKLERKTEELLMADTVVCPSQFVYDSLPGEVRLGKQCVVSQFGSPGAPRRERRRPIGKLRLLFAGSMTQRKGLADLFAAMRMLNRSDVELHVMGRPLLPLDFYYGQYPDFVYEPTRGHSRVLELMLSCDVLVLPSIVEGRALVQQEALACGLPIIVTRNAGGEDLVRKSTGFLVPPRSPVALAEKIEWFATNRDALEEMRPECQRKAASYSWRAYAQRILGAIGQQHSTELGHAPVIELSRRQGHDAACFQDWS